MKGKLLRGISGSVQPRRLLHGYQDAVFAWSGENPFANLAQSNLYRILPRTQYSNSWVESTPHGQAFRADNYSGSGHGYVFSSHVPSANITYAAGVTGYAELVYSADIQSSQFAQHLCAISSSADGNTGDNFNGVLTLGFEVFSGKGMCPVYRVGNNTTLYGFAGGNDSGGNTLVPVSIPVGTLVRQIVTFDPVSKAYASILEFNDVVYEEYGTVPNGFASTGSSILVGGYPRNGVRAAYVSGMLEAAIWNRAMPLAEMRELLHRPSIFQPTEFVFPFSFGESSGGSEVINSVPEAIVLSPAQAAIRTTEALITSVESLSLAPAAASIQTTLAISTTPDGLSIAGLPATLHASSVLAAIPAALVLQPVMAGIYAGEAVIDAAAQALTITSGQATIVQHGVLATTAGNISLHGVTASLSITGVIEIQAKPAIISLSGVNAGIALDSGSVNFGTTNTSRYFLSDAMAGMDLSGDFSIVAVISPDYTVSDRHKYFFSTGVFNDPPGLNLYLTSNDGFLSLLAGNGAGAVTSVAVPPSFCLVYARRIAGVVSVGFVDLSNGAHTKSNTSSSSSNFSNNVAVIGGRFDLDATRFYAGGMSWIALLETGLSDGQIESIAAGTTGLLNDFEPSVVELWDMTYNRSIQPGVVNGINAERFGDGWGVGGDNPLPYEIADAEIISAIPAAISLHGSPAGLHITNILATNTAQASLYSAQAGLYSTEHTLAGSDVAQVNKSAAGSTLDKGAVSFGDTNASRRYESSGFDLPDLEGDFTFIWLARSFPGPYHKTVFDSHANGAVSNAISLWNFGGGTNNNTIIATTDAGNRQSTVSQENRFYVNFARRVGTQITAGQMGLNEDDVISVSGSATMTAPIVLDTPFYLGDRLNSDGSRSFRGSIAWFAVLDKWLTNQDIIDIASGGTALLPTHSENLLDALVLDEYAESFNGLRGTVTITRNTDIGWPGELEQSPFGIGDDPLIGASVKQGNKSTAWIISVDSILSGNNVISINKSQSGQISQSAIDLSGEIVGQLNKSTQGIVSESMLLHGANVIQGNFSSQGRVIMILCLFEVAGLRIDDCTQRKVIRRGDSFRMSFIALDDNEPVDLTGYTITAWSSTPGGRCIGEVEIENFVPADGSFDLVCQDTTAWTSSTIKIVVRAEDPAGNIESTEDITIDMMAGGCLA